MSETQRMLDALCRTDALEEISALSDQLLANISAEDLPVLVTTIASDSADWFVRELLAEPILRFGGVAHLPELIIAFDKNLDEGHDNDGFSTYLTEFVQRQQPADIEAQLGEVEGAHRDTVGWLRTFMAI